MWFTKVSILTFFIFLVASSAYAQEVTINKLDETTIPNSENLIYYPESLVERPLVLPQKLVEIKGTTEYRQLSRSIRGLDFKAKARIGILENLEAELETSILPLNYLEQEQGTTEVFVKDGFAFGGVTAGATYSVIEESDTIPEIAGSVRLGFAGTGPLSLTNGSTFIVLPSITAKKIIDPRFAIDGNLILGFGNNGSGLYELRGGGVLRPFEQLDVTGHVSLEGVGFRETATLSIIPGIMYHLSNKVDIQGGFRIGLVGGEAIGNNVTVGIATRF